MTKCPVYKLYHMIAGTNMIWMRMFIGWEW